MLSLDGAILKKHIPAPEGPVPWWAKQEPKEGGILCMEVGEPITHQPELVDIISSVCFCLASLHSENYVHRDIRLQISCVSNLTPNVQLIMGFLLSSSIPPNNIPTVNSSIKSQTVFVGMQENNSRKLLNQGILTVGLGCLATTLKWSRLCLNKQFFPLSFHYQYQVFRFKCKRIT